MAACTAGPIRATDARMVRFGLNRDRVRRSFEPGEFREVFADAPPATCEARDPKGLYARARRGEVKNFTRISSPYEPPDAPDLRLDTGIEAPERSVERVLESLA